MLPILKARAGLLRRLRDFFHEAGYWEVETPLLSRDVCVDAWLDPFAVSLDAENTAYLQTSPEFAMKRLLCAGADAIYQVTRSFRREELGPLHNPEFAIVEWYRRDEDHFAQMEFVERLVRTLTRVRNDESGERFRSEFRIVDESEPERFLRLTYEEAFLRFVEVSPLEASTEELIQVARERGVDLPAGIERDRDGLLNLLLAELVEPGLKELGPVFLYHYPASQAALARTRTVPSARDPRVSAKVAERFELYLDGIEICNGYHELTDPVELRRRMERQNEKRIAAGKPSLPVESRLLQAMESGFPPCAGVALGFDRLVLHCLGLTDIRQVIPFPFDQA
jgi:elongation factor P--(R)-beta-lysine ligase